LRRVSRLLDLSRSALYSVAAQARPEAIPDALLIEHIHQLIQQHPTYGYRRVWALLRYREGHLVNRKKVYRLMKVKGVDVASAASHAQAACAQAQKPS
jgi:putative transposase